MPDRRKRPSRSCAGFLAPIRNRISSTTPIFSSVRHYIGRSNTAKHSNIFRSGQAEEAITILRRFLGTNPKPDLLDDTYLLLGAALYRAQQYGEALKYL